MIWNFFKKLFNNSNQEELVKEAVKNKALLVDVRTKEEYNAGHVAGSINIPVNKLIDNLDKLKGHETIVLFCASGNRSRLALAILKNKDLTYDLINGGSWGKVKKWSEEVKISG